MWGGLTLLQHQQLAGDDHAGRGDPVLHRDNRCVSHQLPKDSEFVLRQEGDKAFASVNRFLPFECELDLVARASEGDTRPAALCMMDELSIAIGEGLERLQQPFSRCAAASRSALCGLDFNMYGCVPDIRS